MSKGFCSWVFEDVLDVSSADIVNLHKTRVKRKGSGVGFIDFWQFALFLEAKIEIPSDFIGEIELREVLCILGDEDMFSILVQLIGTFWVIRALIQLTSALKLKGSTETVIQF